MPLASPSPPHFGHFTLQVAWVIAVPHFEQVPVQSAILTSAVHEGHFATRSPTFTSWPHLHLIELLLAMVASHFEQCIDIMAGSCDCGLDDEHPKPARIPTRAIALMACFMAVPFPIRRKFRVSLGEPRPGEVVTPVLGIFPEAAW